MKKISIILIFLIIFTLCGSLYHPCSAAAQTHKKVIILINDYIDTSDLLGDDTPNLNALAAKSGTGLINIRAKNKVPASSYMSLASGVRVATAAGTEISFNSNESVTQLPNLFDTPSASTSGSQLFKEFTGQNAPPNGVVNLFIEPAKTYASEHNPIYIPGQLGSTAKTMHLQIGVLGNSDTRYKFNRSAAILAMDANGSVPLGNVSANLVEADPYFPGGLRTNHSAVLRDFKSLLKQCDIVILDMGDTTRVESSRENCSDTIVARQRQKALAGNDLLLGQLLKLLDLDHTMIIMVTPNPNADMVLGGNFSLTPILMYKPDGPQGLLTSSTTRRPGLVSSIDLLPTVIAYFSKTTLPGDITTIKTADNRFKTIDQQRQFYERIRYSRNPLHYTFMTLAVVMMALGFLVHLRQKRSLSDYLEIAILSTLSVPLVFLFLGRTDYRSLPVSILIAVSASMIMGYAVKRCFKPETGLMLLTAITSVLVAVDCFRGSPWMLVSPLGSDTIAGGRFYGIGNDYMGILLAATIIASILFFKKFKDNPQCFALWGLVPLAIVTVAIGAPQFGANVGGLITAIVCMGIYYIVITQTRVTIKRILLLGFVAVAVVVAVALLDARFSANPSHAGKAIESLINGGGGAFLSIVSTKLGILAGTVIHSSWTIILLLALIIVLITRLKTPESFIKVANKKPAFSQLFTILGLTALVLFPVKDTGVIAAAFILLYVLGSFWIALNDLQE